MAIPRLNQVNFAVRDMDGMAGFYERLGFTLPGDGDWAAHHRSARFDDAPAVDLDSIPFTSVWNSGWTGGPGVVLGFQVPEREDVDQLFAGLVDAGAPVQQAPYDAFWGARFAVVSDPDGNAVGLSSPADPAYRSDPPPLPG